MCCLQWGFVSNNFKIKQFGLHFVNVHFVILSGLYWDLRLSLKTHKFASQLTKQFGFLRYSKAPPPPILAVGWVRTLGTTATMNCILGKLPYQKSRTLRLRISVTIKDWLCIPCNAGLLPEIRNKLCTFLSLLKKLAGHTVPWPSWNSSAHELGRPCCQSVQDAHLARPSRTAYERTVVFC